MLGIVAMYLRMALEANRNCVIDIITSACGCRDGVVGLDLNATKTVADAAAPMNLSQ
jgi:hypothetical protein